MSPISNIPLVLVAGLPAYMVYSKLDINIGKQTLPITDTFDFRIIPVLYELFDPDKSPLTGNHEDYDQVVLQLGKFTGCCNIGSGVTEYTIAHSNLRETVVSSLSNSYNRQRQLVCMISLELFGHPQATLAEISRYINQNRLRLYTTEANGALYSHLKANLSSDLFFCSEYFGQQYNSGELVNDIRHEDLQHSSFADETFDIILSADVFEHIPDALKAEREIVRILKKGGFYCFTVPINIWAEHDDIRAEFDPDQRKVVHHAKPEYHGDPVRPSEGVLVYRFFSHRDMAARFRVLGCTFKTYRLYSLFLGVLGSNAIVHSVKKQS